MKQTKRRTFWFLIGIGSVILAQVAMTGVSKADTTADTIRIGYISENTQTVWDLAKKEYPHQDTRRIVHQIKKMNEGLDFGRVQLGQAIRLPGKEE